MTNQDLQRYDACLYETMTALAIEGDILHNDTVYLNDYDLDDYSHRYILYAACCMGSAYGRTIHINDNKLTGPILRYFFNLNVDKVGYKPSKIDVTLSVRRLREKLKPLEEAYNVKFEEIYYLYGTKKGRKEVAAVPTTMESEEK